MPNLIAEFADLLVVRFSELGDFVIDLGDLTFELFNFVFTSVALFLDG